MSRYPHAHTSARMSPSERHHISASVAPQSSEVDCDQMTFQEVRHLSDHPSGEIHRGKQGHMSLPPPRQVTYTARRSPQSEGRHRVGFRGHSDTR